MGVNQDYKFYFFSGNSDFFSYIIGNPSTKHRYYTCKDGLSPHLKRTPLDYVYRFLMHGGIVNHVPQKIKNKMYNRLAGEITNNHIVYIFTRSNVLFWDKKFLRYIKNNFPNITLIAWYLDLVSLRDIAIQQDLIKNYYDYAITYDPYEAKKYNMKYIETPYCRSNSINSNIHTKFDVIFVGKSKINLDPERYEMIISVFKYLKGQGLRLRFYISDVPEHLQFKDSDIVYNKFLRYEDVLQLDVESKCILDIPQANESGTTLRMFEAIIYDRIFLFCNKNILHHEYYSAENMMYFEKPSDINVERIKKSKQVYYQNKDKLSVSRFLDSIIDVFEEEQ